LGNNTKVPLLAPIFHCGEIQNNKESTTPENIIAASSGEKLGLNSPRLLALMESLLKIRLTDDVKNSILGSSSGRIILTSNYTS